MAITLWPLIILQHRESELDEKLVRHERIHLRQQIELLLVGFYLVYIAEFVIHLLRSRDRYLAYRSIGFEQEAYAHEDRSDYLKNRKLWAWRSFWLTRS